MTQMHVTNESPARITLEIDPDWKAETSKSAAESRRGCLGWFAFLAIAFVIDLAILWYSRSTGSPGSLPWYFWVFTGIVLVVGVVSVIFEIAFRFYDRKEAEEATVTLDLDSGRAVRVEKSKVGKVSQMEIQLKDVRRILIHREEAGHACKLLLDLQDGTALELNSGYDFELASFQELGTKISRLLNKPIAIQDTSGGKVTSEQEIAI